MTHPSTERDPGLDGIVPFSFSCHRCGHCCTAGDGYVWLEPGEDEALARALGMEIEAFRRTHVRTVPDPVDGELRSSLVEEGGRCSLLQGSNHCSVYEARPDHCSRFPYWSRVLETREGFERARTVCPGIAVEVEFVGPVEDLRVAVGRRVEHQDLLALRNALPSEFGIPGRGAHEGDDR